MKKSQILAALALAFALGVAMPVAGTYAVETRDAVLTASECSVDMAIAKVENYPQYKQYASLRALVAEASAATVAQPSASLDRLTDAYTDINGTAETPAPTTLNAAMSSITAYKNSDNVVVFPYWETLVTAMDDSDSTTASALILAAQGLDGGFKSTETTVAGVLGDINRDTTITAHLTNWKEAVAAVKEARNTISIRGQLLSALGAWPKAANLAGANDNGADNGAAIAQLVAYAKKLPGYNNYEDLAGYIAKVKNGTSTPVKTENESGSNKTLVNGINGLLKTATKIASTGQYVEPTGNDWTDTANYKLSTADKEGVEVSLADLANIAGACDNKADEDNTFTGDDQNKPSEDGNKVPGAGNTGAVAGADATAKATVSIMAAIASVATAAFVAIRKIAAGKKA